MTVVPYGSAQVQELRVRNVVADLAADCPAFTNVSAFLRVSTVDQIAIDCTLTEEFTTLSLCEKTRKYWNLFVPLN